MCFYNIYIKKKYTEKLIDVTMLIEVKVRKKFFERMVIYGMDINKIFEKWVAFTEVDPTAKRYVISSKNVDVYHYNERIKTAMENVDEYSAAIVLKRCFYEYISDIGFSLKSIILKEKEYLEKKSLATELALLLDDSEINDYEKALYKNLKDMSDFYETEDAFNSFTEEQIFEIYINAKMALNKLSSVQFKKGNVSTDEPKMIKNINMFYNINHLLSAICNNSKFDGISLNCIYDSTNPAYTYFCFVIKNGDNVYMVSDKQIETSISRKLEGRSSGRLMDDRICKFLFPYELLNLQLSKYSVRIDSNMLSSTNDGVLIGNLSNCSKESIIWIIVLVSLLKNKYFDEDIITEPFVYSGGMVSVPRLDQKEYSLLLRDNYSIIDSPFLTVDDVVRYPLNYDYPDRRHHKNDWLLERYIDKIDESYLNLQGDTGQKDVEIGETSLQMYCFDSNYIGERDDIDYVRRYIARKNLAMQVQLFFDKEVEENLISLNNWYENKLLERMDFLKRIIVEKKCILTKCKYEKIKADKLEAWKNGEKISYNDEDCFSKAYDQKRKENCLTIDDNPSDESYTRDVKLCQIKNHKKCSFFNGKPVSYIYCINVNNVDAMCEMLGCNVSDLPELLQHWYPLSCLGEGNSILNNLDPVENIHNALSKFNPNVRIYVSKSEIKEIQKELNIVNS